MPTGPRKIIEEVSASLIDPAAARRHAANVVEHAGANRGEFEGRRVLRQETVDAMFTNQLGSVTESLRSQARAIEAWKHFDGGWGLGFLIFEKEYGTAYQWGGFFSTSFCVVPEHQWTFVAMLQVAWHEDSINWGEDLKRLAASAIVD